MITTHALNSTNYLTSITYKTRKKRIEWDRLRFDAGDNHITLTNWKDNAPIITASDGWREYWRGYSTTQNPFIYFS